MYVRTRLAVQFPAVKSSLHLTENLLGGQLPPIYVLALACWPSVSKKTTKRVCKVKDLKWLIFLIGPLDLVAVWFGVDHV